MKKTKEEVRDWLLENCVDERGNLDLSDLNFSNFKGDVNISGMQVNCTLYQNNQEVGGDLFQGEQEVEGSLFQSGSKIGEDLYQKFQVVSGNLDQSGQFVRGFINTQKPEELTEIVEEKDFCLLIKKIWDKSEK